MPRIKSNKEYAIRLTIPSIPELGHYYYSYNNNGDSFASSESRYMFTQDLSKVNKRKTLVRVKNDIIQIQDTLKLDKGEILISFGKKLDEDINENVKSKLFLHRGTYYLKINKVFSNYQIENAKKIKNDLDKTLSKDAQYIADIIKNSQHFNKNFIGVVNKLSKNVNLYKKSYNLIKENEMTMPSTLDIVDASHNFRFLKLKKLAEKNNN